MHTLWNRVNSLFFFAISVIIALSAGSWTTTLWLPSRSVVRTLRVHSVKNFRAQRESRRPEALDRAVMTFDLDADLRGIFNWNVKVIFVYVSAVYDTAATGGGVSEVVIWDTLLHNASSAHLRVENAYNKYPLVARRMDLRGVPLTLTLNWDVMPTTGILKRESVRMSRVRLPLEYCNEDVCKIEVLPLEDEVVKTAPPEALEAAEEVATVLSTEEQTNERWKEDDL